MTILIMVSPAFANRLILAYSLKHMILSENAHVKFIQQNEGFDFFLMNKNLRANKANLHLENLTYVNSDQETPGCIL